VEMPHKILIYIPIHNLVINCAWVGKYWNISHSGRGFLNEMVVIFKPMLFYVCHIDGYFKWKVAGSIFDGDIGIFR
jgi:hypothetical protein